MGTEYIIHQDDDIEISLGEMSNKFSLDIYAKNIKGADDHYNLYVQGDIKGKTGDTDILIGTKTCLTPEQVVNMSLEMIKVAFYWLDETDKQQLREKITQSCKENCL